MGIGLVLVFYVAHTRFWVVPIVDANGVRFLWMGATANRNRDALEQRFQELTEKAEIQLQSLIEAPASAQTVSIG